jgi:hypothetical protein
MGHRQQSARLRLSGRRAALRPRLVVAASPMQRALAPASVDCDAVGQIDQCARQVFAGASSKSTILMRKARCSSSMSELTPKLRLIC